jgi:hypothetical protein
VTSSLLFVQQVWPQVSNFLRIWQISLEEEHLLHDKYDHYLSVDIEKTWSANVLVGVLGSHKDGLKVGKTMF